jgi:RNA polymerase sigma-70 factor (ECF subfamily)
MDQPSSESASDLRPLLDRAVAGDTPAWRGLVARYHDRLRRMVAVRLDPMLHSRLDPSDVLQEAYLDAFEQLPSYLAELRYPFFLWLRLVTGHRLAKVHRYHVGTQMRDAAREVSLFHGALPEASSAALAAQLLGRGEAPFDEAARAERRARVQDALNQLEPLDREVLSLRHFEQLTSAEAAEVLGISKAAASKRYLRAVAKLRAVLSGQPGGLEELT